MIDERFSAAAFEARGLDTASARELADLLAREIMSEIHEVLQARLTQIIEQLNSIGHNLKEEYQPVPGDLSYREDWEDEGGYHCKLRVGLDIVVSTGYAHLLTEEDVLSACSSSE